MDQVELHEAVLLSSSRITPESTDEVRQLVMHVAEPAFYFPEGQNIGVLVPGPHPFGMKEYQRYYTIAKSTATADDGVDLELLVRRCFYIDDVSGEQYAGIASNFLCNAAVGNKLTLTGPFNSPFRIPSDSASNLLMLGTGTGIAPFRAFLRRLYEQHGNWQGKVRLYYGAKTGTDMLYMNDLNNDVSLYFDQETFKAIQTIRQGLLSDEGDALQQGIEGNAAEIWSLMQDPKTHVFLAGMKKVAAALDGAMAKAAGSSERWVNAKQELIEAKRWSELTYH